MKINFFRKENKMKYNFDFDKLREKGTCIRFNDENEFNIFVDRYNKNINEVDIYI